MKRVLSLLLLMASVCLMAQQNPVLPTDPAVRTGKLENGLTYYIRQNKTPENRVDFYIAQNVGSMQEEDPQAGLAHFLEHMAFNGTTHFPGKSMLNYLQDNGIQFGGNINAYTSFDQTVYYISNVPADNKNLVDSCILVLYDWSCGIALEEEELDKERGVIREEWRTRGGSQQRLTDKLLPALYPGSKYANRMPIGSIDVINNFKPEEIRAYYHKWYRPDLQGIIIVGDVNVDETEKKVKDLFSGIKLDENRAERVYFPVPDNDEPIVAIATDKEARNTLIRLFYKHDAVPREMLNTQAGYMMNYVTNVAAIMFNDRFNEITQKPNAPFTFAQAYNSDYFVAKTKDAWTVVAGSAEDKVDEALAAIVRETERVKKHGFTASEYERARTNLLQSVENAYNNRDKQKNNAYAEEYVRSFTDGEPIPGIEYEYQLLQSVAPQIPVEAINQTIQQLIGEKNIVVAVTGPEKEGLTYPGKDELLGVLASVKAEEIEPYAEEVSDEPLIAEPPAPGTIAEVKKDEAFGTTVWKLSNGVTVVLKDTDFKDDEIRMMASSYGGTSQYVVQDPVNAKMAGQVMTLGGVGNFSTTELPKVLAGKTASARPIISMTTQGFAGSSSIKDFETMLQLVYLYFTAPRTDQEAFASFLQRAEIQMKNIEAEPSVAFQDSILKTIYGDNPITKRMKAEDLKKIDYPRIMEMYKQSFVNPGSFVFSFVGNIDEDAVKPVILQYLGSLKGKYAQNTFIQVPLDVTKGRQKSSFEREMQNPKGSVYNVYSGKTEFNLKNSILMSMFEQILRIVYTEKVREDEGGTYGVGTNGSIARYPEGQTLLEISFDTDPDKANHLNEIVEKELKAVAEQGPRQEDFTKVKEHMVKKYDEDNKENGYWLGQLQSKYFYGQDRHSDYLTILNTITPQHVQEFAKTFLSQGNEATVIMLPKKAVEEKK
ncbi:MAG TPA: peptidase M16 [Porphyromonadaceae bacterium]|nr:peptidase M16 [Porphyromonadaceae bacterium]HBX20793.1 peptidase M16 [Porphyromonadaceae bacterium]HCM20155.1 peptidase M16 [Porphyromonadaceae bacterium]